MKKSWIASSIVTVCGLVSFVISLLMVLSLNKQFNDRPNYHMYGNYLRSYISDLLMVVAVALFVIAFIIIFTAYQKKKNVTK